MVNFVAPRPERGPCTARERRPPPTWQGAACGVTTAAARSDIEQEVDDVAVLDDVLFPLDAQCALRPRRRFAAVAEQLVPADHLRPDEASLEIGVDRPGRLGCSGALP